MIIVGCCTNVTDNQEKMTHSLKSARYTLVHRQRLRLKVTKSVISFDDGDLQQDDSMDTNDNDNSDTLNVQSPTIQ